MGGDSDRGGAIVSGEAVIEAPIGGLRLTREADGTPDLEPLIDVRALDLEVLMHVLAMLLGCRQCVWGRRL